MFDSKLPENIDWDQINAFLRITKFYKKILLTRWRESEAFTEYPVLDMSIECFRCLHEDLVQCYRKAFAFDEKGREDRIEEYRLLWECLSTKYNQIDENLLKKIYSKYLIEDR